MKLTSLAALASVTLVSLHAFAQIAEEPSNEATIASASDAAAPEDDNRIELEFSTYGTILMKRVDFFKNSQDKDPRSRWKTDLERVVLEPELEFYPNIKLEAEIEFEHGGTGTTLEYEADEAGEIEQEVEAGGEVIVEKLMLQIEDRPWLNYRFGYITVPVGMISQRHHPSQYFTVSRNRAEERILPSTWRETGATLYGTIAEQLHYELGVFNGLQSEQFNSPNWIQGGQSRLFEDQYADNLAYAIRLDYGRYFTRWLVGASFYRGDSADNRRILNKLNVPAHVTIWDVHAFYDSSTWSARAMFLQGDLENADKVSAANDTLPAGPLDPGALYPVGSQAQAWFAEVGYNIQKLIGSRGRTDIFGRYDFVDPMKSVTGNVTRLGKFQEQGWTAGVNWYLRPEIVFKAQYGDYKFDDDTLPSVQEISLGFGWFFSTEG